MKKLVIFLLGLIILPSMLAIDLEVNQISSNEVFIQDLEKPVIFELELTNNEDKSDFEFYNLLGFDISPSKVTLDKQETKQIKLEIIPHSNFNIPGFYIFNYFVQDENFNKIPLQLTFETIQLEDAFEIGSEEVSSELNTLEVFVHNKKNFNFGKIDVKFSSAFFNLEKTFEILPYEKKTFEIELNKEDFKKLKAGFYNLNAEVNVQDKTAEISGVIKFPEQDIVKTENKNYGFLINTNVITKTNEGNVVENSETRVEKNIISRLFTTFNPEPDFVDRKGSTVIYIWHQEINPGESIEINIKTNWLLPLILIVFLLVIVILVKQFSSTDLNLRKKVTFVRAKGGEFALKVSIFIYAKEYIEKVSIIDRLPSLVKLYEKFGGENLPKNVDEKNRRIRWEFEKLERGETRMLSYIIYSKIGVLGRFALPKVTAIFEREGKIKETESNRAFFVAEPRKKDLEE